MISIAHAQPDRRLVGRRPIDPVLLECRDVDKVTRFHFNHAILELQPGLTFQNDDPLVLRLVIPEPGGRCMAARNDPLDAHVGGTEENLDQFLRQVLRDVIKEVVDTFSAPFAPTEL